MPVLDQSHCIAEIPNLIDSRADSACESAAATVQEPIVEVAGVKLNTGIILPGRGKGIGPVERVQVRGSDRRLRRFGPLRVRIPDTQLVGEIGENVCVSVVVYRRPG